MQHNAAASTSAALHLAVDPILEARAALRRAVLVPFEVAHAREWSRQFARCLSAARRALSWHGDLDDDAVAPLSARGGTALAVRPLQQAEHLELMQRCADLLDRLGDLDKPDVWDMVELSEAVKLLERDIEAYRQRMKVVVAR